MEPGCDSYSHLAPFSGALQADINCATGGLRPSLSCEAKILIIQDDFVDLRGHLQGMDPFTRRVNLNSMIKYMEEAAGIKD